MGITKARIIGFLMIAVLVALSASVIYADNGNGGNFGGGHWGRHVSYMKGKFCHKLNLTDAQKKQLKDIWHKQREAMKATFEQIKVNKEALTNELLQTTPDVNKINDLKSKIKAFGAQMLDNRINSNLEVKKILTAQQFAKYLELQKRKFSGRFHQEERGCRHHGNRGDQRDGDYGEHHGHDNGDNE